MKKYLSILFLGLVAISSCQETGQEELKEGLETMLKDQDPVAYENKHKELTLFMGEVFKNSDARMELFDLANADDYEEDISYSLKTLLETNQNPNTRQSSAIYMNFQRCRVLNDNFNLIGDTFNSNGTLLTRNIGGEEYPVITQDVAQFVLRIRQ